MPPMRGGEDLQRLVGFLKEVNHDPSLDGVSGAALRFALSLIPAADKGAVFVLDPRLGEFAVTAAVGWDSERLKATRLPKEKIAPHLAFFGKPRIVRWPLKLALRCHGSRIPEIFSEVAGTKAALLLPLRDENGGFKGCLCLVSTRDPGAFSSGDLERLRAFEGEISGAVCAGLRWEELRERERFFRFLLERMADAVYVTTLDGEILEANPAAERQTGYSRRELLGMNIMRDLAAEEPAVTWEKVNERLLRGEVVFFEEKKRRKDGTPFWTEVAVALIEYRGRPATVSINRDITERKRLQEELERRISQLRALNRATKLLVEEIRADALIRTALSAVKEATGSEYTSLVLFDEEGKPIKRYAFPESPSLPLKLRKRGFAAWVREVGEPLFVHDIKPDGSTEPPVVWPGEAEPIPANPLLVEAGIRSFAGIPIKRKGRTVGILYADSRRPNAFAGQEDMLLTLAGHISAALEKALLYEGLKESEAHWRLLFEESPVSLWITDLSGVKAELDRLREQGVRDLRGYLEEHPESVAQCMRRVRVEKTNRAALELYGASDTEELSTRLPEIIPLDEAMTLFREGLLAIWEGKPRYSGEGINRTLDGKKLWVYLTWGVMPGHEKDYGRVLISIVDITARVEAEEALREVNSALTALSSTLELPELLRIVRSEARRFMPFDAFFVALVDRGRGEIRMVYAEEGGEEVEVPPIPLDPGSSPTAWVAVNRRPLFIEDVEETPPPVPFKQVGRPVRAWAGIPLIAQGEVIGVLSLQSFAPLEFGEREKGILSALAAGVAVALRNALLHGKIRSTAEKLRAIEETSRRMKLADSKRELYDLVLDAIHGLFGYPCAILEASGDTLTAVAARGCRWAHGTPHLPLGEGSGFAATAYRTDEPLYVPDVRDDPRRIPCDPDPACELALPISVSGKRYGVLDIEHGEVDGIPPEDRDLLRILASELAVALAGLERLREVERINEKLALLHEISQKLQRCASAREICEVAAKALVGKLGFEHAVVALVQGDYLVPVATAGALGAKARPFRKGEGIAGKVWISGKPLWGRIEDFPEAMPVDPGIRSTACVPIEGKGQIQVVSGDPDAFGPDDLQILETLARHIREELRRVELEEELREQAIRDPLTGLYNRRFLDEVLRKELARAERYGHPLALIVADIDDFKEINDTYGHLEGDRALIRVAKAFKENIRESDYIFRWGGDEFVILLTETNGDRARRFIKRMSEPFGPLSEPPTIRLSFGHAVYDPRGGELPEPEELFREADRILYGIKRKKRR